MADFILVMDYGTEWPDQYNDIGDNRRWPKLFWLQAAHAQAKAHWQKGWHSDVATR